VFAVQASKFRQIEQAAGVVANQARCKVKQQFVHQPLAQQRTVQLEASLGVHLVDATATKLLQQGA